MLRRLGSQVQMEGIGEIVPREWIRSSLGTISTTCGLDKGVEMCNALL